MMNPTRLSEVHQILAQDSHPGIKSRAIRDCILEIERLSNIVTIQQKQIERLMDARDCAEIVKSEKLTCPTTPPIPTT